MKTSKHSNEPLFLENEIWKSIIDWEGYEVSNLGRVKNLNKYGKNNIGKAFILGTSIYKGYISVALYNKSKRKQKREQIHRLQAIAFIPNPENKPQVNHINGIKHDNKVENLEWNTRSENMLHSYRVLKRKVSKSLLGRTGELCCFSKAILQFDKKGNFIKEWISITEAAKALTITASNISYVCLGKRNSAGGFKWKFKNQL